VELRREVWFVLLTKSLVYLTNNHIGLAGGIVQVPESLKTANQPKGYGVTIYHMVDSIDEVNVL